MGVAMARAILEVKAVTKRFGRTLTADALSLTVDQGEFFNVPWSERIRQIHDPAHGSRREGWHCKRRS
jgi:hypothetical protein